ncbi:MAG TPA: SCO family protein [Candidatus Dormibacteraeota bacterium]|nr:SCO family protein [Candidatus Dormibacteraeota bacterium]
MKQAVVYAARKLTVICALILAMMASSTTMYAQQTVGGVSDSAGTAADIGNLPNLLKGVNFNQNLGAQVPLDTHFVDSNGNAVTLSQYFGKNPVVLILAYYKCPLLCPEVLHGADESFKKVSFHIGQQYNVVTLSINPKETPELAAQTKKTYISIYGDPAAASGWHFLTGKTPDIKRVADAVGFHYKYIPQFDQYAHAAGIVVLTPQGKVAQYFYGIKYSPEDLRLALVQSSQDKIGSVVDQVLLFCCTYDPDTGRYHAIIARVLAICGGITILAIGGLLWFLFRLDEKKRRDHPQPA